MGVGASTRSPADGLPPIGDYGLIGDTRTAALVSADGAIDWLCVPGFDGDPLFGRRVGGPEAGTFRLGPACRSCWPCTASARQRNDRSRAGPATPAATRCGSATARPISTSSTATAGCWTPPGCSPAPDSACTPRRGGPCAASPTAPPGDGASPMPASGRSAATRPTTSTPSSWPGSPSIGRCASPPSSAPLDVDAAGHRTPRLPRVHGTIDAIRRELGASGSLLYRYLPGHDGLAGTEGAFLPCSFWLVQALAKTGRRTEATERFAELLDLASPLGLYAEQMDPTSRQHLGNYPQALTHAALVQAALALRDAEQPGTTP